MAFFAKLWTKRHNKDIPVQPIETKVFYLISAAGMPNFGDDMLTRYWVDYLQEKFPGCTIYLDAVDSVVASELFPTARCVDYVWRLAQALGDEGSVEEKFADPYALPSRERLMEKTFEGTHSIHLLGGGYINELWGANARLMELAAYFAKKHDLACYATGLGLQPLSADNAEKFSPFIRQFDHFDVRDRASFEVLEPFAIPALSFTGDDYFAFPDHPIGCLIEREQPTLHLCIHTELSEDGVLTENLLAVLQQAVSLFSKQHPDTAIKFYEFRPGSDGVFFQQIRQRFPQAEFICFEDIWRDGLQFSTNDFCISSRFHFQVIAASLGIAGIALSWSDYYDNKFASLQQMSDWPIATPEISAETIAQLLSEPRVDRHEGRAEIHEAKRQLLARLYDF
ncbi:polysaccharide pyruvyl transferase family protein [Serratia plymuthica]|uniref:Polysaccharide pyruvyl transferase CsaB n=1 Tax=Serratia plymuthica TaxID=82996 RepID=A0A2X4X8N0_SERPL|nr:polysaccharide pyruvyl transferase family protein [Serratia plymuthica]QPS21623.1 polysaccharide pyruvyl transferase family protein [Serratia plymuthica]QPS63233.1 polysaccharide pyruvyl transferase family protein [Serratia plymuthica]RKS64419.1 polysaccharide pyruvyl transferase [Serratia plymuthica]CAI2447471.1 polysaccharide pyruvyl transferase CsaB [Serratia plymuthica]SQI36035.1 polysaccharide pyruvyl transferase CsaB [Serratia plymuthica]